MGLGEKKELVVRYISQGLTRDAALSIAGISKHQYYYQPKKGKQGRKPSSSTPNVFGTDVTNEELLQEIELIQADPVTRYGYRKMTMALRLKGFVINAKKVHRLMKKSQLLRPLRSKKPKNHVQYRKVLPKGPLQLLEMDIKMTWLESKKGYAYTLSLIDTYTRVVLHRITQHSIKKQDVKRFWDHVIVHYLQPADCLKRKIDIEVRNDNDKRFSAALIEAYFKENHLNQVFTHPLHTSGKWTYRKLPCHSI